MWRGNYGVKADRKRVASQVERIRASVLRRHGYDATSPMATDVIESSVDEAARLSVVNAHWGIASDEPLVGPVLVVARRVMRLALRWYINPLVEQQNTFNEAVVRALHELRAENDDLRARLERATAVASDDA
jgi:hypothetical protein